MKVLFLGYTVDLATAKTLSGASIAGNKMQWNVVQNMQGMNDIDIQCVSITPRAPFPKDKKILQKRSELTYDTGVSNIQIRYWNIPILKQFSQTFGIYRETKKLLKRYPDASILCYNLFTQIGQPVSWLKKRFTECQVTCLLADLPIDDKADRKGFSRLLRRLFDRNTNKNLTVCDKYIVLNKKVAELYLPGKPYIVVDGGVDEEDVRKSLSFSKKAPTEKNIMYCGALTEYNGVRGMIAAIEQFRGSEFFCDIYGSGYLEEEVKCAAEKNENIRFHGRVDNATVMQKQREAWLLLNPRVALDPIAQVTFPSKTFEYLLSGTPVLSTKLNGYSEEYDSVLSYYDETPEDFARAVKYIDMNYEEIRQKAEKAIDFVTHERLWKVQAKKIADFIVS